MVAVFGAHIRGIFLANTVSSHSHPHTSGGCSLLNTKIQTKQLNNAVVYSNERLHNLNQLNRTVRKSQVNAIFALSTGYLPVLRVE